MLFKLEWQWIVSWFFKRYIGSNLPQYGLKGVLGGMGLSGGFKLVEAVLQIGKHNSPGNPPT